MDRGKAIELVRKFKSVVANHLPIHSVYIFGSYSKGGYTEESDIDVAVIVPKETKTNFDDITLLWRLGSNISTYIEPVLLREGDSSPLYYDILKTGFEIK